MTDMTVRARQAPGDDALRAMFAARKRVFIDLLKWDLPVLAGKYELDHFDNPSAHYLILMGPDGEHRASARILPTTGSHLLGDLFSELCEGEVPRGESVREISRFCIEPSLDAGARRDARNQLVTALAEHAVQRGITDYTAIADICWFGKIRAFGWKCEALGPVADDGENKLTALRITIDNATIDGLKANGIYAPLSLRLAETGEFVR